MVGRWRARASHDTIATVEENDGNDDGHDGGDEGDIDGGVDDTSEFEQQLRAQGQFGRGLARRGTMSKWTGTPEGSRPTHPGSAEAPTATKKESSWSSPWPPRGTRCKSPGPTSNQVNSSAVIISTTSLALDLVNSVCFWVKNNAKLKIFLKVILKVSSVLRSVRCNLETVVELKLKLETAGSVKMEAVNSGPSNISRTKIDPVNCNSPVWGYEPFLYAESVIFTSIIPKRLNILSRIDWRSPTCTASTNTPRGRLFDLAQDFIMNLTKTFFLFQIAVTMSELMVSNKGSTLLKSGRVAQQMLHDGSVNFVCRADGVNCSQQSESLAGIAIHVARAHTKSKPDKRKATSGADETPARKQSRQQVAENEFKEDVELLLSDAENDAEDLEETFRTTVDDTTQEDPQSQSLLQQEQGGVTLEMQNIMTPDKSHTMRPTDSEMKELVEQASDFFYREEEDNGSDDGPHVMSDSTGDALADSQYFVCSACGHSHQIYESPGQHMVECHLEELNYCPNLWKDDQPTYLTAVLGTNNSKKVILSCLEECRNRIVNDQVYFNTREESVGAYKASISNLSIRLATVKAQMEASENRNEDGLASKEILQSKIADLEDENARLAAKEDSFAADKKAAADKLRDLRKALSDEKKKSSLMTVSANASTNKNTGLSEEVLELKRVMKMTENRVLLGDAKIKQLQRDLNSAMSAKAKADVMRKEAEDLVNEYISKSVVVEELQTEPLVAGEEPMELGAGMEDFMENNHKQEAATADNSMKRRCKFLSWATGCRRGEKCNFFHPVVDCQAFLEGNCRDSNRACNLLHDYKKRKSMKPTKTAKNKPAPTRTPQDSTAKKDCKAWTKGRCPHHVMGQDACPAGLHRMNLWGTMGENAKVDSQVAELTRPVNLASTRPAGAAAGPSFPAASLASPALRLTSNLNRNRVGAPPKPRGLAGQKQ